MSDAPLLDAVLSPAANGRLNRLVFIGSTSRDLPEERAAVIAACRELGLGVVAMEDFPATGKGATAASQAQLDRAAVYVGIFAHRYGYVEPGYDRSVTECEYDHAKKRDLACLCFLLDPRAPWPDERKEHDQRERIERFQERVRGERVVRWFVNPHDLLHQAYRALEQWLTEHGEPPRGPRQLPAPPADFVGRAGDLEALERHHQGGVAISGVQGQGGVGKTALALKLAERLAPRCPDGQIYLDLRGVDPRPMTPRDALAHVIRSFRGVQHRVPDDDGALLREYRDVLSGRRVLLLWDNAVDAAQVEPLLPPAGTEAVVLVTSRRRFVVPGLRSHDLNTLSPTEAVTLLRSIAPRLTEDEAGKVAAACGRLPLALRLAAQTLVLRRDLTAEDYMRRLAERGRLNELGPVAASIRLSEEQLAEDVRGVWRQLATFWRRQASKGSPAGGVRGAWRQLATFAGGFEKAWAAALWQVDAAVADSYLAALLEYSLLEWNEEKRWYLLHDLVREYADTRRADAERTEAERRHGRLFLAEMVEANALYLRGGEAVVAALRRFDRARVEVEAAFNRAQRRPEDDGALRLCVDLPDRLTHLLYLWQHPRERIEWRTVAVGAARKVGDRCGEDYALGNLGLAYYALGQPQRAIEFYEQHLAIAREVGDRQGEGIALNNLGNAYAALGQPQRAIECYQQHLAIAREVGDRTGEAKASWNMGRALEKLGRIAEAIPLMEVCVAFLREIGHPEAEKRAAYVEELRRRLES